MLKTVLIVAGVAFGVYVVLTLVAPKTAQTLAAAASAVVTTTDTASQQSYAIAHGVTDDEGNQIVDLKTGNALTYGAD